MAEPIDARSQGPRQRSRSRCRSAGPSFRARLPARRSRSAMPTARSRPVRARTRCAWHASGRRRSSTCAYSPAGLRVLSSASAPRVGRAGWHTRCPKLRAVRCLGNSPPGEVSPVVESARCCRRSSDEASAQCASSRTISRSTASKSRMRSSAVPGPCASSGSSGNRSGASRASSAVSRWSRTRSLRSVRPPGLGRGVAGQGGACQDRRGAPGPLSESGCCRTACRRRSSVR